MEFKVALCITSAFGKALNPYQSNVSIKTIRDCNAHVLEMASPFPGPDPPFPQSPVFGRSLSFVSTSTPTLNSWSVTESKSVRVSHTWTIHNFSFVYSIGEEIRSDQFDVKDKEIGNSSWLLVCRMKLGTGERTESPRLCIRLNAKDAERELWVRGCLGVRAPEEHPGNDNASDNESVAAPTALPPTPFGPRKFDVRCGIQISLPKLSDMQRDGLLQNDTLCVYGDLCLWSESFKNSSSITRLSPDIVVPSCDLATDLKSLWEDPVATHADIKLVTDTGLTHFMAHKAILCARSPMFRAMFSVDMKEKDASEIEVVDVSGETLAQMVQFMYTGRVTDLDERADELLAAADKYGLTRLRSMCESSLEKNFTVDTIAHTLVLSHLHSAKGLQDRAIDYIVSNVSQVRQSDGWAEMEKSYPLLIADVFHALVSKQELPTLSLVKVEQNSSQ